MADISDVEQAIVNLISATLYPSGTGSASLLGVDCRVYRGWPNKTALDADIAAGKVNVTVFPEAGGRNTTRYPREFGDPVITAPTLTVTTAEPVVTFGGTGGANQIAGIRTNAGAWAYALSANDTPASVAAALQALVPGASVNGAAVTVSPSAGVLGRVVGIGASLMEVRRQVQSIRISLWCPDPGTRDACAKLVDAALAQTDFLTLADGTGGRLIYRWNFTNDEPTKDALWRRDFRYDVEYATTISQTAVQMLFGGAVIDGGTQALGSGALTVAGDIQPATSIQTDLSGNILIDAAGNLIGVPAS